MFGQRAERYQYHPLPGYGHIRLLTLERGITKPITGRLLTTAISDAPPYYALSYTWGTGKKRVAINVDGLEFLVTPSLALGLEKLAAQPNFSNVRDPTANKPLQSENHEAFEVRHVWIDQICINQNDVQERESQVQQMDEVYSKSQRTIIWLGIDKGFASPAIELLSLIEHIALTSESAESTFRTFRKWKGSGDIDWDDCKRNGLPPRQNYAWKATSNFFELPWFRRVWTIQEVVLSHKDPIIMCGEVRCSWTTVAWAAHWLYVENFVHYMMPQAVRCCHMVLQLRLRNREYGIDALAAMGMGHFATDPRDNVFGLLGLSPERRFDVPSGPRIQIVPDYSSSTANACAASIRAIIANSGSLAILSLPTARPPCCWDIWRLFGRQAFWTDFQSWVVHFEDISRPRHFINFSSVTLPSGRTTIAYHKGGQFRAAGVEPMVTTHTLVQGNAPLQLDGVRVDEVKLYLQCSPWESLAKQNRSITASGLLAGNRWWMHYLKDRQQWGVLLLLFYIFCIFYAGMQRPIVLQMWETALEFSRYKGTLEVAHAVMRATTAGMKATYEPWTDDALPGFCALLVDLYARWPMVKASNKVYSAYEELLRCSKKTPNDSQQYAVAMQYWCGQRRFFVTEAGLIGIGPSSMRRGDVVCVLFGGGVPYILRPFKNGWYFIGDCYIHDLERGQAVDAWRRGDLKRETFAIS